MEINNIEQYLKEKLTEIKSMDNQIIDIDIDEPFENYGIDSIKAVYFVGELEQIFNIELPPTLLWEYNTIRKLTNFLKENIITKT